MLNKDVKFIYIYTWDLKVIGKFYEIIQESKFENTNEMDTFPDKHKCLN